MRYEVQVQIKSFLNELLFRAYHVSEDDIIKPGDDLKSADVKKKIADVKRKQKQIQDINYLLKNRNSVAIKNFIKSDIFSTPEELEIKYFILYLVEKDLKYLKGIKDISKLKGLNLDDKFNADFDVETLIDEDGNSINDKIEGFYNSYRNDYLPELEKRSTSEKTALYDSLKKFEIKFFKKEIYLENSQKKVAKQSNTDIYRQISREKSPEITLVSVSTVIQNDIIDQKNIDCLKQKDKWRFLHYEFDPVNNPNEFALIAISPDPENKPYCFNVCEANLNSSKIENFLKKISDFSQTKINISDFEFRQYNPDITAKAQNSGIICVDLANSLAQEIFMSGSGFDPKNVSRENLPAKINEKVVDYATKKSAKQILGEFLKYDPESFENLIKSDGTIDDKLSVLLENMSKNRRILSTDRDNLFAQENDELAKLYFNNPKLDIFFQHLSNINSEGEYYIKDNRDYIIKSLKEAHNIYGDIYKDIEDDSIDVDLEKLSHIKISHNIDEANQEIAKYKPPQKLNLDYYRSSLGETIPQGDLYNLKGSIINLATTKFYASNKVRRKIDKYSIEDSTTIRLHSKTKLDTIAENEEYEFEELKLGEDSPFTIVSYDLSEEEKEEVKFKTGKVEDTRLSLEFKKGKKGESKHKGDIMLYYYLGSMTPKQVNRFCVIYQDLLGTDFNSSNRREQLQQAELEFDQLRNHCFGGDTPDYSQPISAVLSTKIRKLQKTIDDKSATASEETKSSDPTAIDSGEKEREEIEKLKELQEKSKELQEKFSDNINLDNVRNFLNFIKHQQKSATQKKAGYKIETSKLENMQDLPSTIVTNVTIEALMKNNQMLTTY